MTDFTVRPSYDGFTPDLMNEVVGLRSPFRAAYDAIWRKERLLRYVFWLNHRDHPPFNIVGSWVDDDIRAEIDLWKDIRNRDEPPRVSWRLIGLS